MKLHSWILMLTISTLFSNIIVDWVIDGTLEFARDTRYYISGIGVSVVIGLLSYKFITRSKLDSGSE